MSMIKKFEGARYVSVPILVIRTADQQATVEEIAAKQADHPLVKWDTVLGLVGINKEGEKALVEAKIKASETINFVEAMLAVDRLKQRSVVFAMNAHRQLQSSEPLATAAAVQAVSNLRDSLKKNFRMLVLLVPDMTMPTELGHDVVLIDHDLPGPDVLATIVTELYQSAQLGKPSAEVVAKATDAMSALSTFEAEQEAAMSLTENGLDIKALWERKMSKLDQVRGISFYRGTETFADLIGLDAVKAKFRARIKARTPVGVVVWIDEGADVFQNVESDTSGVKTDQQRALLVEMENNGWPGVILTGVPGSGKSALARAFGNEAGVPCVALDFGDMEAPHVGESEALLRQAIRTIKQIGRGHAFFVLTCNSLAGIRPQFMRRFKKGVYMFEQPTADECEPIWRHYEKKFQLKKQARPNYTGWTGAEIRECCEEAWDTGCTLVEAAVSIIPVTQSRVNDIEKMRRDAHGRFLDATKPGRYLYNEDTLREQKRAIALPPAEVIVGALHGAMNMTKES